MANMGFFNEFLFWTYLKADEKNKYFYPTKNKNICQSFPRGKRINMIKSEACCDGDPNPPCWLGFSNILKDIPK